jgi:hypothetical protein
MPTDPPSLLARPADPVPEAPPPRLDAHCDRIVANLTARLAARAQAAPPPAEPRHDFLVLGFLPQAPHGPR